MTKYEIKLTRQARKDIQKLSPKLRQKLRIVFEEFIAENPYDGKPLIADLQGNYSVRLTYKDRIVYSIDEEQKVVYIKRARTHYGD